jgi:hypothetical protein
MLCSSRLPKPCSPVTTDGKDDDGATADPLDETGTPEGLPPVIERGQAFTELPIPCGGDSGDDTCQRTADSFCSTLGYGPPIDFLAAEGALHVIRCKDEF